MKFSSKAKNLSSLKNLGLKKSKIPKFYKYSINEIDIDKKKIVKIIKKNLSKKISIRSSFFLEDKMSSSMAGEFDGLYNVKNNENQISKGIHNLIDQYKKKSKSKKVLSKSEIIFQNHISNSSLSGVITNKCIKDGTNYYVINYDDTSNLTNTVTSGGKSGGRVINIFKENYIGLRSIKFKKIVLAVQEIETIIGDIGIDIEFAVDKFNNVQIFQIRPISTSKNWKKITKSSFLKNLKYNQNKLDKHFKNNKYFGDKIVFGLMPDWNPVEMIGYQPSKLSYSLYDKLITNDAWSISRSQMGYKKVGRPLMYKFTGKPFIDARLSFFSFLPNNLNYQTSKKIVNNWCNKLQKKPYLHDKIEFEISDGSFDVLLKDKIKKHYKFLNTNERNKYYNELKNLTENLIKNFEKNFDTYNNQLIKLEKYRSSLIHRFLKKENFNYNLELKLLINQIKVNGTIPFSKYARHAFIGKKFLNSLKLKKIISLKTYNNIINSIDTIASKYIELEKKAQKEKKFKKIFYKYFFHLRPGTYDLRIDRYKDSFNNECIESFEDILSYKDNKNIINKKELVNIKKFLFKNNIGFDVKKLINFCVSSIKLRENSKFIFTRSLSDMLELIKEFGKIHNLNSENLSKLSIDQILKLNKNNRIDFNKNYLKKDLINLLDEASKLPYLITSKDDFFVASNLLTKPNFITNKNIKGIIELIDSKKNNQNLTNKIIFIENADPGYDWIFSKKIKGLVTKYGGINSHMSIRCEELNLPAVIGLGEENFEKIKNCTKIVLNCKNEQILGL